MLSTYHRKPFLRCFGFPMETLRQQFSLMGFPSQGLALLVFVGFGFFPLVSNGTTHRQLSHEKGLLCDGLILRIQGMR